MSFLKDDYGLKPWVLFTLIVSCILAIITGLGILTFNQYRDFCDSYQQQTGQETKYDRPNFSTAVCYVHTQRGWVDIDQLNVNKVE